MEIREDDLEGREIATFLQAHLDEIDTVSPRESQHVLDLETLRSKEISMWSIRDGGVLVGCGALRELGTAHGEIKSMRVDAAARGKGVASALLQHILQVARQRGFERVSLETGSADFFGPARKLYRKFGFEVCLPFADYREDPNSVFMTRKLQRRRIKSGATVFLVMDVQRAAAYYRDALGFRFDELWGDPPDFCMVWRDEQCFMLAEVRDPNLIRPVSSVRPSVWDAYLWVEDAEQLHAELVQRGAQIKHGPVVKPYGVKEFVVMDLDGHQIAWGEEL